PLTARGSRALRPTAQALSGALAMAQRAGKGALAQPAIKTPLPALVLRPVARNVEQQPPARGHTHSNAGMTGRAGHQARRPLIKQTRSGKIMDIPDIAVAQIRHQQHILLARTEDVPDQ